jgi:hypothetical protein
LAANFAKILLILHEECEYLWIVSFASMFYGVALIFVALSCGVVAQPSPEELGPLLTGFSHRPQEAAIERRVPLSTNDPTVAPLIDLQVFAPPVAPKNGKSCIVTLLKHTFGMIT